MSPITHFLAGWALAHTTELNPRELVERLGRRSPAREQK
jgi:hypothetical protein